MAQPPVETPLESPPPESALPDVARALMHQGPMKDAILSVLDLVTDRLSQRNHTHVRVNLDGVFYGEAPEEVVASPSWEGEIRVGDSSRGRLCARPSSDRVFSDAEKEVLSEVAALIGLRVGLWDRERECAASEEKHRALSASLAREMWSRTEALAKETRYLEGILQSSDDIIITTDLNTLIVEFNAGAEKILGYTAEEMEGRPITDIWEDAAERADILEEVRATGGVKNYETRLKTKSGDTREISLTLSLLKDEDGRTIGTVGVSKDISREKAIVRELEQLNRNYRETLSFINHEFKNSLIVTAGFVRRLLDSETDQARKEQLQIVYHHSKFLEAMTKDFLVMAEIESGEFKVRKELIKDFYREVILPAMVGLKERYPDSFETYDVSLGGVGAIQLWGDQGLLEIVYRNLFGNALKYRSPGGKIAYGVVEQTDSYIFNVWNQGPGVDSDSREKIFEKFYRADDESVRKKRGTGLGLYNIRRIIQAHGGKIWCESHPGHWINFLFILPKE
jgi:PAS domain S-box-containing protein